MNKITQQGAMRLIQKHKDGNWKIRTEQIASAAHTGDSGWRETYLCDDKPMFYIEWPNARYKVVAYSLV